MAVAAVSPAVTVGHHSGWKGGNAVQKPHLIFVRLAAVLIVSIGGVILISVRGQSLFVAAPHFPRLVVLEPQSSATKLDSTTPKDVWQSPLTANLLVNVPFARVPTDLVLEASIAPELLAPDHSMPTPTNLNPRKLREMMDRGVVAYASATTPEERTRAAKLIQFAAQLGYGPARDLIAHNYPHSEVMRSVVPEVDAIRYTLALVTDESRESDETKAVFAALVAHAAATGTMDVFAKQLVDALRRDQRPHLNHRLDLILEVLAHVHGACSAIAPIVAVANDAAQGECSSALNGGLFKYVQSAGPR